MMRSLVADQIQAKGPCSVGRVADIRANVRQGRPEADRHEGLAYNHRRGSAAREGRLSYEGRGCPQGDSCFVIGDGPPK